LGINGLTQIDPGPTGTGTKTYAANIEAQRQWSLTLGEIPTSPLELTGAYAASANDGSFCTPAPVLSITDQAGQPVALKRTPCTQQMTPEVARTAVNLMVGDTKAGGTSARVFSSWYARSTSLIAGKTGTSTATNAVGQEYNTGFWFVGLTPTISATMAIVDVKNPTAPVGGIPGVPDDVARTTADGSIASQYWFSALNGALSLVGGTKWNTPSPTGITGSITVPVVTGQTLAAATTMLTGAGFKVETFPVTCGSTALFGQVAYYSPQTAAPGTTVSVCMSNAQVPYTIPVPKPTPTPTPSKTPGGPTTPGAPTVGVTPPGVPTPTH
jgi:membrane peptidoglycan carboxypeptidase